MPAGGEIFIEFVIQGNFVKATAIDGASGTEASIVGGPASAPQAALADAARRKLEYLLKKKTTSS